MCSIGSQSLSFKPSHDKTCLGTREQPRHRLTKNPHRLTNAFSFRSTDSMFFLVAMSEISNLFLAYVHSLVCVGPSQNPRKQVFSRRCSFLPCSITVLGQNFKTLTCTMYFSNLPKTITYEHIFLKEFSRIIFQQSPFPRVTCTSKKSLFERSNTVSYDLMFYLQSKQMENIKHFKEF